MKKILFVVVLAFVVSLTQNVLAALTQEEKDRLMYGGEWFDDYRKITYWARVELSISDHTYNSGDATYLKLVVKDKVEKNKERPREDLKQHFISEFKRLFARFNFPFHDIETGREERLSQFYKQHGRGKDAQDVYEEWQASELARRRSLYGGRAGAIYCNVRVKRRDFPVLYEISCSVSAKEDLSYSRSFESEDLGFSSPEHIGGEIKTALTEMLKKQSLELSKIMKYGK